MTTKDFAAWIIRVVGMVLLIASLIVLMVQSFMMAQMLNLTFLRVAGGLIEK